MTSKDAIPYLSTKQPNNLVLQPPEKKPKLQSRGSQALILDIRLREVFDKHPESPSRERVSECFKIWDEIIPQLGPLSSISKTIRDEIYRSVFSKDLTSSQQEPFVERIPYFRALARLDKSRVQEWSVYTEKMEELQQKLKFRDQELKMLHKKSIAFKQAGGDTVLIIQRLKDRVAELEKQTKFHDNERREVRSRQLQKEKDLQSDIESLKASLEQSNNIIQKLTVFKTSFSGGENEDEEGLDDPDAPKKVKFALNQKSIVDYDIAQALQLDAQFSEMLDCQLDDYEYSMSQLHKKKEILSGLPGSGIASETKNTDDAVFKLELSDISSSFKKRIAGLMEEQKLLRVHVKALEEAKEQYDTTLKSPPIVVTSDEPLWKYAITMGVSLNQGSTYEPLKSIPFCSKCGDRTVICPHRTSVETVIIPPNVRHIKFYHPTLNFKSFFSGIDANDSGALNEDIDAENNSPTFTLIWEDFYTIRNGKKPKISRKLPDSKLLSAVNEFYEAFWLYEERLDKAALEERKGDIMRFRDYFYDFQEDKYLIKEVSMKAVYDMLHSLHSLEKKSNSNNEFTFFLKHLSGEMDCTWKYLFLIKLLILSINPTTTEGYNRVIQTLYPGRSKEMYEQMELEFVSFASNKITPEAITNHFLHLILNQKEYNYLFFIQVLKKIDYQQTGTLMMDDFDEAISNVIRFSQPIEKKFCFNVAALEKQGVLGEIPIERLAHIGAYIALRACYEKMWLPQIELTPETLEYCKMDITIVGTSKVEFDEMSVALHQSEVDEALSASKDIRKNFTDEAIQEEQDKLELLSFD